ncbi:MAG: hypothetical protein AABZ10_03775 [Nitrospirota bacterium]
MDDQGMYEAHETQETRQSPEIRLQDDLRKGYRLAALIGVLMIGSVLVYAVIAELIKESNAPFQGFIQMSDIAMLRNVLLVVAAVEFIVIPVLNRVMLSGTVPPRSASASGQHLPEIKRLISSAFVTYALCESVAIYGLVLFLLNGNSSDLYLFIILSVLLFTVYFPKYSRWEAWFKARGKTAGRGGA